MHCVQRSSCTARLCDRCQLISRHVEGTRGPSLVDCDIDAPEPSAIHANVCDEAAARYHQITALLAQRLHEGIGNVQLPTRGSPRRQLWRPVFLSCQALPEHLNSPEGVAGGSLLLGCLRGTQLDYFISMRRSGTASPALSGVTSWIDSLPIRITPITSGKPDKLVTPNGVSTWTSTTRSPQIRRGAPQTQR